MEYVKVHVCPVDIQNSQEAKAYSKISEDFLSVLGLVFLSLMVAKLLDADLKENQHLY